MQTVLVTGGTGFLGSKIVERLLRNNYHVIILVRENSTFGRIENIQQHPNVLKVILNKDLEDNISKFKIDAVIHTATCYGRDRESWSEVAKVNLQLPLRLLVLCEQLKVKCFVNADTFFNEKIGFSYNEHFYVKTKKNFLEIAKDASSYMNTKFVNIRIEQMYGPNDNPGKFIPFVIGELFKNVNNIPLTEGDQRRDFVFVDDVADMFVGVCKEHEKLCNFEEFGAGYGPSVSIREVVEYLKLITKSTSVLHFGDLTHRKNEIMDSEAVLLENSKINWQASTTWQDGMKKTVDFYSNLNI